MLRTLLDRRTPDPAAQRRADLGDLDRQIADARRALVRLDADIRTAKAEFETLWERDRPDQHGASRAVETARERGGALHMERAALADTLSRLESRAHPLRALVNAGPRLDAARAAVAEAREVAEAATAAAAKAAADLDRTRTQLAEARTRAEAALDAAAEALTDGRQPGRQAAEAQTAVAALERAASTAADRDVGARRAEADALTRLGEARHGLQAALCQAALAEAEVALHPLRPLLAQAALAAGHPAFWRVDLDATETEAARAALAAD